MGRPDGARQATTIPSRITNPLYRCVARSGSSRYVAVRRDSVDPGNRSAPWPWVFFSLLVRSSGLDSLRRQVVPLSTAASPKQGGAS